MSNFLKDKNSNQLNQKIYESIYPSNLSKTFSCWQKGKIGVFFLTTRGENLLSTFPAAVKE